MTDPQINRRWSALAVLILACSYTYELGGQAISAPSDIPAWAFPTTSPPYKAAAPPFDTVTPLRLPGSSKTFTMAQVTDRYAPPDWYPNAHPPLPPSVARGRQGVVWACGYCHLPDGQGRAENAMLSGLPAAYMIQQVAEIRSRARKAAIDGWGPSVNMRHAADSATDKEIEEAARFFSRIKPRRRYTVVEQANIPVTYQINGVYAALPDGGSEPIGNRIIEMTRSVHQHELRDATETFVAYVPPGSIATGKRIAIKDTTTPTRSCVSCHGPDLRGRGLVPPIAGRSPTYMLRQLLGFKTGARAGTSSAAMQSIAAALSLDDMIAVSSYAGSLRP